MAGIHSILSSLSTTVSIIISDLYAIYTSLFLSGDGINSGNNNTFIDSSTNNFSITPSGTTAQGSFSPYGSNWSNYFDGSTAWLLYPWISLGTGDYTLECWSYYMGTSQGGLIGGGVMDEGTGNNTGWTIIQNTSGVGIYWQGASPSSMVLSGSFNNGWNHFAFVRSGTTVKGYVNGFLNNTVTSSYNMDSAYSVRPDTKIQIGTHETQLSNPFMGYISNVRIANVAIYSTNFTPSTNPLTAVAGTQLLTCQSNRFNDNSANNYSATINGSPSVQRFSPFTPPVYSATVLGGSSYISGINFQTSTSSSVFAMGTGDFTIECWFYAKTYPNDTYLVGFGAATPTITLEIRNSNVAYHTYNTGHGDSHFTDLVPVINAWNHMAITRISGTMYGYLNGKKSATTFTNSDNYVNGTCYIQSGNGTGYISDTRITKGIGLYTANFTPNSTPLTASANTSFLCNFTNGVVSDTSTCDNFNTINTQITTSNKKYGTGSLSFNGTNCEITYYNVKDLQFGTGDFTIEAWVYKTGNGANGYDCLIGLGQTVNATEGWYLEVSTTRGIYFIINNSAVSSTWSNDSIWHHIAIVRYSGVVTIYLDGNAVASATISSSVPTTATIGRVGNYYNGTTNYYFNGNIDDLRVTKGYARYIYNFTPPTKALTYSGTPSSDPTDKKDVGGVIYNIAPYTTLLLQADGTNGAQNNTFLDSSSNNFTITRNGNTTQGSFSPYGSNWSNYFDGSSTYLSAPSNVAFDFGTGNFTIEFWVYANSLANSPAIIAKSIATGANTGWFVELASNTVYFGYGTAGGNFATFTVSLTTSTWTHIACTRVGGTLNCFVNGVSPGSVSGLSTGAIDNTNSLFIAHGFGSSTYDFNGYISNLRVVKGTAVYTSNFTPSTTPLTAISGTSLLTCQSNRFIDNSSNNFALTVNGTPSVQRFSPFAPTSAYNTATIGGSIGIASTGYLTSSSTASVGSGDNFTIEGWVYLTQATDNTLIAVSANDLGLIVGTSGANLYSYDGTWRAWGAAIPLNRWTYLTIMRSSGTAYVWKDGVYLTSFAFTAGWNWNGSGRTNFSLIGNGDGANRGNGYWANWRFSNIARYNTSGTSISAPTAPLTFDSNTTFLLNGTNGAIYDNAMMNDLETVGNAQISTTVKKYGTGSMYFDGTGDYLYAANNPQQRIMGGDFTIEMWMYLGAAQANMGLVSSYENNNGWIIRLDPTLIYFFYGIAGSAATCGVTYSFSTSTWYHIAWVKSGSSLKCYINGTQQVATFTVSGAVDTTTAGLQIGRTHTVINDFNGYIDDLRITKGYARYTTTFTPPTAALPTS